MKRYNFHIEIIFDIEGEGEDEEEAFNNAIDRLAKSIAKINYTWYDFFWDNAEIDSEEVE